MPFWDLVRADLHANTGYSNSRRIVTAFLFNPGFAAIFLHRVAARLHRGRLKRLGIMIWRWNVSRSGCHLHLDSEIGPGLILPHPVGIVIGSGAKIGPNVTIFQTVTIGKSGKSEVYPTICEGAVLYPNSVIIGAITVGERAIVGAASVVVKDVPADATVAGNPARVLQRVG